MTIEEIIEKSLSEKTSNDPKIFKSIIKDYLPQAHSSGYDTEKLVKNAQKLDDKWLENILKSDDNLLKKLFNRNIDKVKKIVEKLKQIVKELEPYNDIEQPQTITNPLIISKNNNKIIIDIKYLIASVAIIILIVGIIFIFKNLNTNVPLNKVETTPIEISLNDKILKQLGYKNKNKNEIISIEIPETFKYKNKYYKITKIEDNIFKDCEYLSEITIPNSVIKIGNSAFENCLSLKTITIPNGVKEIGDSAFRGCLSLEHVDIPDSVKIIGENAFNNCLSLSNLKVPDNVVKIGENAFTDVKNIEYLGIAKGSPWGAISLNGIVAQQDLKKQTQQNSKKYIKVVLDKKVLKQLKYLGYNDKNKITHLNIPATYRYKENNYKIIKIEDNLFKSFNSLEAVIIPNSVIQIGNSAFKNCSNLTHIKIPNSVTHIENSAFGNCSKLTYIKIPNSVTHIGNSAFSNCSKLTYIKIPNSVTHIGNSAFENCSNLRKINIPKKITTIENDTFNNCTSLKTIKIPDCVNVIGDNAFNNCQSLNIVSIPNSVVNIGNNAFGDCVNLQIVNIPVSVNNVGIDAFKNVPHIYCKKKLQSFPYGAKDSTNNYDYIKIVLNNEFLSFLGYSDKYKIKSINISSINKINGESYKITKIGDKLFEDCKSLTNIKIIGSVTEIGDSAFKNCSSLTNITIPNSVTEIGYCAFENCTSLKNLVIPYGVTYIGYNSFANCTSLNKIKIPNSITDIGDSAFKNCSSLTIVTIPSSVRHIGARAFENCISLKNLVIPYSVTEIGYLAFYNVQLVTYNTATSESIWKGEKNSRTVIQIAKNINIENINIDDQAETKQSNNNPKHYNNYNNVQKQTVKYNNDNSNVQDTDNKKKGCWYWGALIVGILFVGAGTSFLIMEGGCENGCLFYILGILQYICLIVLVPTILMKFHLASCWFLGLTVVILLLCLIPRIGWGVSIITTIFLLCQLFF